GPLHHPGKRPECQSLPTILTVTRLCLDHVAPQFQQDLRDVDLYRTNFGTGPAETGSERQPGIVLDPRELWRDDGADRPGIYPGIAMAANLTKDRTMVQTRAAANAI